MKNLILAREQDGEKVWLGDGIRRRHVADPAELDGLKFWIQQRGGDPTIHNFADLRVLGVPAPPVGTVEIDYLRFVKDVVEGLAGMLHTLRFDATTKEDPVPDRLTVWGRTVVPARWATLVARLVSLSLPPAVTDAAAGLGGVLVVPAALAAVYALLRWVERRLPRWLTVVLLGSTRTPHLPPAAVTPHGPQMATRGLESALS